MNFSHFLSISWSKYQKFSRYARLSSFFDQFTLSAYFAADLFPKNPAKNRAKLRFWESGGWGINKKFWPEYLPLGWCLQNFHISFKKCSFNIFLSLPIVNCLGHVVVEGQVITIFSWRIFDTLLCVPSSGLKNKKLQWLAIHFTTNFRKNSISEKTRENFKCKNTIKWCMYHHHA